MEKYQDRKEAGKLLATHLSEYANRTDVIVLALPRGGVPVAFEIAQALSLPLDVFIVRKIGVPAYEELAMGAIAMGGVVFLNSKLIEEFNIENIEINAVIEREQEEIKRREKEYRGNQPLPNLMKKTVLLVDDGIATGATMQAAIETLRKFQLKSIVVAVPVAPKEICQRIEWEVNHLVCPLQPDNFYAVGQWYENFSQTEDSEVKALLGKVR